MSTTPTFPVTEVNDLLGQRARTGLVAHAMWLYLNYYAGQIDDDDAGVLFSLLIRCVPNNWQGVWDGLKRAISEGDANPRATDALEILQVLSRDEMAYAIAVLTSYALHDKVTL